MQKHERVRNGWKKSTYHPFLRPHVSQQTWLQHDEVECMPPCCLWCGEDPNKQQIEVSWKLIGGDLSTVKEEPYWVVFPEPVSPTIISTWLFEYWMLIVRVSLDIQKTVCVPSHRIRAFDRTPEVSSCSPIYFCTWQTAEFCWMDWRLLPITSMYEGRQIREVEELAMTGRTCFAVTLRGRNPKSGSFTIELVDGLSSWFAVGGAILQKNSRTLSRESLAIIHHGPALTFP